MESRKNQSKNNVENNNNDNSIEIGKNIQIEISYFFYKFIILLLIYKII